MPYDATVFRVLIGGPGDTREFKDSAYRIINEWNAIHSEARGLILLPIRWELDSRPQYGSHPQTIINDQLVDRCDAMIAVFRDHLGTPTESNVSGTVEEFERVHKAGKPVFIYLYEGPPDREKARTDSFRLLEEFKRETRQRGLHQEFTDLPTFENRVTAHIAHLGNQFSDSESYPVRQVTVQRTASQELDSVVRRHQQAWQAEEMSEPNGIADGVALLRGLRDELTAMELRPENAAVSLQPHLVAIAARINKIIRHKLLFDDDGESFRQFWSGGNEIFDHLNLVIGALVNPEQEFPSDVLESAYEQQRLLARLTLDVSPPYSYRDKQITINLVIKNLGQHTAQCVSLNASPPLWEAMLSGVPSRLDAGLVATCEFSFTRRRDLNGQDVRVHEQHMISISYEDGTGKQRRMFIVAAVGTAPDLQFSVRS